MVQKARADANSIRARAQHLLDEAEAIQEEAQRVMAWGRDSLAKAVSLNPRALRSVANTATALSEAMRTEWHLRRGIRQQAEEEADWAKQRATDAVLDSLAAVRKVSNCVSRELEEARRTAATGESLKESSQNDLRRANVMTAEAESLMRREAQRLLNQPGLGVNTFSPGPRATIAPTGSQPEEMPDYPSLGGLESGSLPSAGENSAASPLEREVPPPSQTNLRQLRPEIPSTARLEALLDDFRRSLEVVEAAPVVEQVEEQPIIPQTREPEMEMPGIEILEVHEESLGSASPEEDSSLTELEAALEEFLAGSDEPQAPAVDPQVGYTGGVEPTEPAQDTPDLLNQLSSSQVSGGEPSADDLQTALNDFLRSVENTGAVPSTDDSVEISPAPGPAGLDEENPDLEDFFAGIQDQLAGIQDHAETLAPETLESALSEFLQSAEDMEFSPAEEPVQESPVVPSEGILLDNLDFSPETGGATPLQEPSSQDDGPARSPQSSIPIPPPSHPQEAPPSQEEVGDDHFAGLRDSLAGLSSGEEPATAPNAGNDRADVLAPPGLPRAATPIEGPNGLEAHPNSDHSQPLSAEETYSGIIHILVAPGDEPRLSFFWNVLDSVAGLGKVIDAQPPPS